MSPALRQGAAVALASWYLMMPPEKASRPKDLGAWAESYKKNPKRALGKIYDLKAPLSRWTVVETYETESGCKEQRSEAAAAAPGLATIELSKCVESSDRRLKRR